MAEFMTPEEIQAQAQSLYEQYDKGYISAKQLQEGLNDCNKGVRNFTQDLKASLNQLGTATKKLGEDLKDGKQGAGVFKDALNSGADAVSKAATQFGPLGVAIGAVVKVLTFFVTAANEQADALYKANQDLSKVGAAGARGMTEIYENLKEFGYGVGELGDMGQLITQNSVALSNFYGTVAQGTKAMAGVAKGIQAGDLQRQFMNMGYSVNDINKGIGNYISQQAAFGTSQKRSADELKLGAAEYLTNMATLSKLTGQSADEMAQQRDEALAIDSFNAAIEGMSEADKERQLERYNYLSKIDKDAAIGYANQVSGFVGLGKQSQQLFMTTGGVSNKLARDSQMSLDQFGQSMADATAATHGLRKSQALLGNSDTFLAYGKTQKLSNMSDGAVIKAMKDAKDQTAAQAEGSDKVTDSATKLRQSQMSSRDAMQDMIQKGVLPVTEAMEGLADLIDNIVHPISGGRKAKEERAAEASAGSAQSNASLKAAGLKIKQGDVQQEGAELSPKLVALAKQIQGSVPGFSYFSGFNDKFHNEQAPGSGHTKGLALDFTVAKPPTKEEGQKIADMLRSLGATKVIDEYNSPSAKATAGHFHAEVKAMDGAILNGPAGGYRPNLTMHGEEAIVPLDKFKLTAVNGAQANMPPIGTAGIQPDAMNNMMSSNTDNDGTGVIVTELRNLLSEMQRGTRTQRAMAS
jgi:hypothetical protein